MNKIIRVKTKTVYGNELIYPLDYQEQLKALTSRLTLTKSDITALKGLGFTFIQESKII